MGEKGGKMEENGERETGKGGEREREREREVH